MTGLALRRAVPDLPRLPDNLDDLPRLPLPVPHAVLSELVGTVREALADAAVPEPEVAGLGLVTASHHATAASAEHLAAVLDRAGPRWLAPQCFLYYSPHSLSGQVCIDLGLTGPAITLTGAASGVDALGYAAAAITLGRCRTVLVAAVHWRIPRPDAADRSAVLTVAAAVLAADAGWARVTGWRPGGGHSAVRTESPDTDASSPDGVTTPLVELAAWRAHGMAGALDLVLGGSRLTVRPEGAS